jgi:pyrimidine-nucleoside phosphorylase
VAVIQEIIAAKRDGHALSGDQIREFMVGAVDGSITDYQVTAMLMAIYLRGMTDVELSQWCEAMIDSGSTFARGSYGRVAIDKHSTGGVGDKISLPLGPAVAACGLAVPMISGRGLGHTGGTLDKLESIPGMRVMLEEDEFVEQVRRLGIANAGQTARFVPADRLLYALRDSTATVASVPLIASSIMSKKLAEGLDGLVLDVKVGDGAFMRTVDEARTLATAMRVIGAARATPVVAVLTRMDEPLGRFIGNSLEVLESVEILQGGGPTVTRDLVTTLGSQMLIAGRAAVDIDDAGQKIAAALDSGRAAEVFTAMVQAQGGDPRVVEHPREVLPLASEHREIRAQRSGVITAISGYACGMAVVELGGGRRAASDHVDPRVGIDMVGAVGQEVSAGEVVAILHVADRGVDDAVRRVTDAITVADGPVKPAPLVREILA